MTTKEYETLAFVYLNKVDSSLALNQKYIDIVVEKLVAADAKYDPKFKTKLSTFRYNSFKKFAIRQILAEIKNNKFDQLLPTIQDRNLEINLTPLDELIEREEKEESRKNAYALLEHPKLSSRQKTCLHDYYILDKTMEQIAEELGVSKQAVCQQVSKAISIINESR